MGKTPPQSPFGQEYGSKRLEKKKKAAPKGAASNDRDSGRCHDRRDGIRRSIN